MDKWECCDLGEVKEFYACISHKKEKIFILTSIHTLLEHFSMTNAKSVPTPLPSNWVSQLAKGKVSPELLRNYQALLVCCCT
jgi:hypothetical protein